MNVVIVATAKDASVNPRPRERNSRNMGPMDTYRIEVVVSTVYKLKISLVRLLTKLISQASSLVIFAYMTITVRQLPQNMPKDVLDHFQKVFICKRPMNMTLTQDQGPAAPRSERPSEDRGDKKRNQRPWRKTWWPRGVSSELHCELIEAVSNKKPCHESDKVFLCL